MDRTRVVNLKRIPDQAEGRPYLFERFAAGPVRIARQENGHWLFAADTLAILPEILDSLAGKARVKPDTGGSEYLPWHLRFREGLAPEFKRHGFLLENWHWLGILTLIAVGVVLDKLLAVGLRLGVRRWRERTAKTAFHDLSDTILRPFALMFAAILWWLGLNLLALPEDALLVLMVGVKFLAGGAGVWAAYRLVVLLSAYMADRAAAPKVSSTTPWCRCSRAPSNCSSPCCWTRPSRSATGWWWATPRAPSAWVPARRRSAFPDSLADSRQGAKTRRVEPRDGSWTGWRVRLWGCRARRNDAEWQALPRSCNAVMRRHNRAIRLVAGSPCG